LKMKGRAALILLNKPPGVTSFKALEEVKNVYKKVGHTGTLDKFAEGLLVILTGPFTKLNPLITPLDKSYIATIKFGQETDTLDPEGEVIAEGPIPNLLQIEGAIKKFTGPFMQIPPLYSALHVEGERAHRLARGGLEFEIPPREVEVYSSDLLSWDPPYLKLKVHCSKGTYIRSLARDIALEVNSRAHLTNLVRVSIGPYNLDEATSAPSLCSQSISVSRERLLRLGNFGTIVVNEEGRRAISYGNIPPKMGYLRVDLKAEDDKALVVDSNDTLLAIAKVDPMGEIVGYWALLGGEV
jgi:tRNA pseudouridine55 synthase